MELIKDKDRAIKVATVGFGVVSEVEAYLDPEGEMSVIKSVDISGRFGSMLHVSCARRDRKPNWSEIDFVKERFFGKDKAAMILLTPEDEPIGSHTFCIHLWEVPENWRVY